MKCGNHYHYLSNIYLISIISTMIIVIFMSSLSYHYHCPSARAELLRSFRWRPGKGSLQRPRGDSWKNHGSMDIFEVDIVNEI